MLTIGLKNIIGRRLIRKEPAPPGEANYLLTAAGNVICTAGGSRIKLRPGT